MKKILSVLLVLLVGFGAVSCAKADPNEEVTAFFEGLQSKDTAALLKYLGNEQINMLLNSTGDKEALDKIYQSVFKNFSYEILSTTQDGDNVVVQVKISNVRFTEAFENYERKSYEYMMSALYADKVTKEKLNKKCLEIFAQEIEAASKSDKIVENTVDIKLEKDGNNGHHIAVDDALLSAITGGLTDKMGNLPT